MASSPEVRISKKAKITDWKERKIYIKNKRIRVGVIQNSNRFRNQKMSLDQNSAKYFNEGRPDFSKKYFKVKSRRSISSLKSNNRYSNKSANHA